MFGARVESGARVKLEVRGGEGGGDQGQEEP